MIMDITTETLVKIAQDAREAANKELAREVPFRGSMPAAESYGYPMYSVEAKLFSPVYLYTIGEGLGQHHRVPVDKDGYIILPNA
jgi:hypothetical protein